MTSHPRPRTKSGGSLYGRILLLAAAIGLVTAAVAGVLTASLVRANEQDRARHTLSRLADSAAASADLAVNPRTGERRAVQTLKALRVQSVSVSRAGATSSTSGRLAAAVQPADIRRLLDGHKVAATRDVDGTTVLVQGRPTRAGGVVLLQRQNDAVGTVTTVIWRTLIAFAIAFVIAAVIALIFAWRIVRPLRRTAAAAHALAHGERAVTVTAGGPAEVAEIADGINSLADSLARSEARQRDFVLSVSHDLRTPLTTIRGYAESLADGVIPAHEVPTVGATVLAESLRLHRMVDDLLDLGRLDAGELRTRFDATDLTALVTDIAAVWRDRAASEGLSLRLTAMPVAPVRTDAARLRQALEGLLDNAVRAAPPDALVVLDLRTERGVVILEVRDSGPGLTDADLPVAFQRGVLHDRYRNDRPVGNGLGLAIVHGIVTALGGRIEAGHAPEGGARFTIRLPLSGGPGDQPADESEDVSG